MKKSFAEILSALDDRQNKKLSAKLPEWASLEGMEIPSQLALEQCSSTATALYKACLTGRAGTIVDITGGLGVDSWAFSGVADRVFYFERNQELVQAAGKNFAALGISNITVSCECITQDSGIPDCDLLFADPARRSDTGKKVFLLEDCTPDILTLLPMLWRHAPRILLKLSPMADISMIAGRLGPSLKEIHVVGHNGECKELLCLLERDWPGGYAVIVADLDSKASFRFSPGDERAAAVTYTRGIRPGQYLFEPSAPLMKSGCFKLISERFGIARMSKDTQLYVSDNIPEGLKGLGKIFRIDEVHPMDKASLREIGKACPEAEVTARGIPMSSDELRGRTGCKSGGSRHLFGCSAQIALPEGMVRLQRMIVLCTPITVHSVGIDH